MHEYTFFLPKSSAAKPASIRIRIRLQMICFNLGIENVRDRPKEHYIMLLMKLAHLVYRYKITCS